MASEYHRGEMEIQEQTSTYHLFVMLTKWGSLALTALLVFLVLAFCTPTSFFGSLAVGVIIAVGGYFVLREHGGDDAH
ncbi:cytochrome C oxidase subunit IV [Phenylobacterium sp. Root77]|jgi:archaellum biogenesis protein FlaJ (TadC family)|uniref:aa3-type cytochrome c oxidase subunit IV n=1 Tax=unclassified Phenylobacterium TaxID=2640670 RepID=UPI0006F9553D|nr:MULTISPECIES: aa3-type cytochrome c oxidase subunit IV [unclassified Phenylobacterium]KQW70905.1 cytochrome C oxidase subunit IV [Phenylobacterium sp. Root1277]KQW90675.1 cytochrome C oxidase subunit IV [Phenylobacterium sp. Root1290]KRC39694.1 cytochrome C oxidase subunit IV [Phenylobacterium sp. Root77]